MTKVHKEAKDIKEQKEIKDNKQTAASSETVAASTKPASEAAEKTDKPAEDAAHWKDVAMRAAAEAENIRKRAKIDVEKAHLYANNAFAKDLLPVVDCLESAIQCAADELKKNPETTEHDFVKNLEKGVEMTHKQLMSALEKQGIKKIESLGRVFDPNLHKVIQEVEDETHEAGTILQELQTGYTIGSDRVLREAMVIVAK